MILEETVLPGVLLIHPERHADNRGSFSRTVDAALFATHGLPAAFAQWSASVTARAGTVRGLHWQDPPHAEGKLVRCVRGAAWDVAVDLRPGSPTRLRWAAWELSPANGLSLWLPPGFAHGMQALAGDTELLYAITVPHHPPSARGARFDDPALGIAWPLPVGLVSERDARWPDLS